ncbi:hypothetical protein PYCCODRAFT_1377056 [Trametes coccinea BRFM310]|uniref:Mus7/MMS22 family-domain-containing protein n=1 Tax=Trametes coccinea (strain BRFM310) TaxID=1353009 RepID=A0A1Y2IAL2_TRAC3|nr:hypothetical protein PYCCODRAFT_1377056 [Trametes coccinea BRFM310]
MQPARSLSAEGDSKGSTGSPSSSPDPIGLFTPPRLAHSSPAHGQSATASPLSSPLTPTPSSAKRVTGPPTSPVTALPTASNLASLPGPSGANAQAQDGPSHHGNHLQTVDFPGESADLHDGRYSLRARKARQLNPYEYDKMLYKRQMRANPEAIVKVVSPPRPRRRHRSTSAGVRDVNGSSGADDDYHIAEEDDGLDEDARWERRMMKSRERGRASSQAGDEDPRDRPPKSVWYPDALKEPLSGSSTEEEDAALDALERQRQRERRQKEREERLKKRKPRPFPVRKKDMQPSKSPARNETEALPPRPRPRPRPRRQTTHDESPPAHDDRDGQEAGPSTPSRRRRSVTFSSPAPVPSSVQQGDEHQDNDFAAFDDFEPPVPLPPTPATGTDDGASSEPPLPPTSSTPPEVMDFNSQSDEEEVLDLPLRRRHRARSISRMLPGLDSHSSSESGSGLESTSSSMDEQDRRRMKVLNRMMPAVLIKRLEQKAGNNSRARRSADRERSRGRADGSSEDEQDRPLRPGESRKRIRSRTLSNRSIEIRGDSESSDVNMDVDANGVPSPPRLGPGGFADFGEAYMSDAENEIRPIAHQPRPRPRPYLPPGPADISLSDDTHGSVLSDSGESISDDPPRPRARRPQRNEGEAREGDLIDRMLSRTRLSSHARRKRKTRTGGGGPRHHGDVARRDHGRGGEGGGTRGGRERTHRDGGHSGKFRVTTGGAKRYGAGRQTLLPFKRLPTSDRQGREGNMPPEPPSPEANVVEFEQEAPQKSKVAKRKQQAKQVGLYVFSSGQGRLVTGRSNSGPVTIDEEAATRGRPHLRREGSGRVALAKSGLHKVPSAGAAHPVTLEQFWPIAGGEESDDSFVVPDDPEPQAHSSQQRNLLEQLHRVTVDLDIQPLPAGISFPSTTYLGHGWLYELINLLPGTHDVSSPPSCSMFECYLHPDMSAEALNVCLESLCDQIRNLILGASSPASYETCHKWQTFLHAVSQHLSWLLAKSTDNVQATLTTDVESLIQRLASLVEEPVEILPEDEKPNALTLQVSWFVVEASCRLASYRRKRSEEVDVLMIATSIKSLISKLWDFSFGSSAIPLDLSREGLLKVSEGQQIAELWICLVNLTTDKSLDGSVLSQGISFWTLYLDVLNSKGLRGSSDPRLREAMWRGIFSLCALSQFSLHGNSTMSPRLTASWEVVAALLERSPLSADPKADALLPKRVLRKRDEYVRVLVSRCLWLNLKWQWRLDVDDASLVFNRLLDVFKSRRFASLADEPSDFPSFLRHSNLALLHESKRSDTAFTLFLKLVVRAAEELRKRNPQLAQSVAIPPKLKKILSLAVPVGSVPFTKATPPSTHELSMLYNRFSAVAVAIYLEPTVPNLKYRLANARRYVNFKDTDIETRRACIRGAMHLGTLLRHLDLPLNDILDWLGEMTNTLIDEFQAADPGKSALDGGKRWIVVCIQLLLGCVRRILETSSMNPEENRHKYPDPALLQGPWVTRVFSTSTTLSTVLSTGDQIRRFVQAFLDARALVIPKPRRPQLKVIAEDSQESQYDYDQFDLDLDDPDLLAALGEGVGSSEASENKEKDKIVCEIIDKHISPAIFRLVCKHFNDPVYQQSGELSFDDADRWIDCWVGCASVVVQNGKKDWNFYFSFGPQSWEKIIEPDWRRRVGLRFMYMLLQLDPPAYTVYTDRFVDVLFESLATPSVTLEHDYASLLFSIDRLHHPLFRELPIGDTGMDGDYHMTKHEFTEKRLALLQTMLKNLSDDLESEANGHHDLTARNQIHITSVLAFLSTMRDILDRLQPDSPLRARYLTFCNSIYTLLSGLPTLGNHPRLTTLTTWLRGVAQ